MGGHGDVTGQGGGVDRPKRTILCMGFYMSLDVYIQNLYVFFYTYIYIYIYDVCICSFDE